MALAASGAAGAVLVFSLEMSQTQIVSRLLTSRAEIPWRKRIAANAVTENDWQGLGHAAEDLFRRQIYIDDTPAITLDYLRAQVAKLARTTQIGVIFVDYLQLMTGRGTSREQEIANISQNLKQVSKEFDCPLVCLSQLSRKCEERTDKRPIMSDLRESGAIEQDADVVISIYRDIVYKRIADPRGVFSDEQAKSAELIVLKQRNGPTGTAIVAYDEGATTFRDAPREWG
jgi:replicative DNA helicase